MKGDPWSRESACATLHAHRRRGRGDGLASRGLSSSARHSHADIVPRSGSTAPPLPPKSSRQRRKRRQPRVFALAATTAGCASPSEMGLACRLRVGPSGHEVRRRAHLSIRPRRRSSSATETGLTFAVESGADEVYLCTAAVAEDGTVIPSRDPFRRHVYGEPPRASRPAPGTSAGSRERHRVRPRRRRREAVGSAPIPPQRRRFGGSRVWRSRRPWPPVRHGGRLPRSGPGTARRCGRGSPRWTGDGPPRWQYGLP